MNKGFTLIELIVVTVIIGIIIGTFIAMQQSVKQRALCIKEGNCPKIEDTSCDRYLEWGLSNRENVPVKCLNKFDQTTKK